MRHRPLDEIEVDHRNQEQRFQALPDFSRRLCRTEPGEYLVHHDVANQDGANRLAPEEPSEHEDLPGLVIAQVGDPDRAVGGPLGGVASAVLNTSQQVGGSLGTALLNTLFAGTVTAYLTDNARSPEEAQQLAPTAFIEGYHVAFFWGAMLLVAALLTSLLLINARKQDVPTEPGMASA